MVRIQEGFVVLCSIKRGVYIMEMKVKDLTVVELRSLISDTVKEAMEDLIEDILVLSNDEYLKSIEEARNDYKEGKVKSLEEYLWMNEEVKKMLSEIVEKLRNEYEPLKIILFGSYAYGNPNDDSDIDLLILKNTDERRVDRFALVKRIIYNPSCKIPVSPLVYTPNELEERLKMGDDFIKEIIQRGVVLYERANS